MGRMVMDVNNTGTVALVIIWYVPEKHRLSGPLSDYFKRVIQQALCS